MGQSAAVAAQYRLSGQQYQLTSGQHPAGHMVPSHCLVAAIFTSLVLAAVPVDLRAASSWAGSSITLFFGSHLHQLGLGSNKWAVSSSGSTVQIVRAAVPVDLRATSSRAHGSITLLGGSHLHQLGLGSNKGTVSSSGSTVQVVRAAVPVDLRAASSRAHGSITLLGGS